MATKKTSAGGFSQMPKMMTDEPTVILKLKKGGKVAHKAKGGKAKHEEHHGHKSMKHMMDGGVMGALANTPALIGRPALNTPVARPGKPSMAARRMAMMPKPAMGMMKKGGAMHHMAKGGEMESKHQQMMEDKRMDHLEKMIKKHENMPAHLAHKGMAAGGSMAERMKHLAKARAALQKCKEGGGMHHLDKCEEHLAKCGGGSMKKYAKGGMASGDAIDKFQSRSAIEHDEGPYVETEMHTAEYNDPAHGTGGVKESNAGGYKRGGMAHHKAHGGKVHHISGHPEGSMEHHKAMAKHHAHMAKGGMHKYAVGGTVSDDVAKQYAETMMHTDEYEDKVHGPTGGVKEGNAGGYKRGGKVHHKATGGVMESNAGGYKHGGHAQKKAYATGGNVNKQGSPVALVPRGVSNIKAPPVAISMLSGTYKKGGMVAPGNKRLQSEYAQENATNVGEAKADTRLKYDQDVYQGQNIPKMPAYKRKGGMA